MLELRVKELVNNGIPLEEGLELVKILAPYVDVFEPTVGRNIKQSALSAVEPYYASYGTLLPYVKAVKDACADGVGHAVDKQIRDHACIEASRAEQNEVGL